MLATTGMARMAGCKTDFLCTLEREVNNAFLSVVTQECHGSERVNKHLDLNKLLRKANISTDYGYSQKLLIPTVKRPTFCERIYIPENHV